MSWDPAWERVYRERAWGRYPPEELIRFVARHYYGVPDRSAVRILEIGCGAGANLWYLAREGFDAYGLDGSCEAIRQAARRLEPEGLRAACLLVDALRLADRVSGPFFDAVIDVCCLQHNRAASIYAILEQVYAVLKPGGRVFSMMVAAGSWGDRTGTKLEHGTFTDIPEGPAAGLGVTHFSSLLEAGDFYRAFDDVGIEASSRSMAGRTRVWYQWVIEGRKAE